MLAGILDQRGGQGMNQPEAVTAHEAPPNRPSTTKPREECFGATAGAATEPALVPISRVTSVMAEPQPVTGDSR